MRPILDWLGAGSTRSSSIPLPGRGKAAGSLAHAAAKLPALTAGLADVAPMTASASRRRDDYRPARWELARAQHAGGMGSTCCAQIGL